jgi:lipopolysaccharide biosynthesis protein
MTLYHDALRARAKRLLQRRLRALACANRLRAMAHPGAISRVQQAYRTIVGEVEQLPRQPDVTTAVVVHLFYEDRWARLQRALEALQAAAPVDIFVTLRDGNGAFSHVIRESCPRAVVHTVPNMGRDVLPFMQIAPALAAKGYTYVLKLHSKKSPHHPEAATSFESMVSNLVPSDPLLAKELFHVLSDPRTGVIGPAGHYLSLRVSLEKNEAYLRSALCRLGGGTWADIMLYPEEYGFFGGTMFWARLDCFEVIFQRKFSLYLYELERGQRDGTFAHALERLFCLVPVLGGRVLWEISPTGLRRIEVANGAVPPWSDEMAKAGRARIGPKATPFFS